MDQSIFFGSWQGLLFTGFIGKQRTTSNHYYQIQKVIPQPSHKNPLFETHFFQLYHLLGFHVTITDQSPNFSIRVFTCFPVSLSIIILIEVKSIGQTVLASSLVFSWPFQIHWPPQFHLNSHLSSRKNLSVYKLQSAGTYRETISYIVMRDRKIKTVSKENPPMHLPMSS